LRLSKGWYLDMPYKTVENSSTVTTGRLQEQAQRTHAMLDLLGKETEQVVLLARQISKECKALDHILSKFAGPHLGAPGKEGP